MLFSNRGYSDLPNMRILQCSTQEMLGVRANECFFAREQPAMGGTLILLNSLGREDGLNSDLTNLVFSLTKINISSHRK